MREVKAFSEVITFDNNAPKNHKYTISNLKTDNVVLIDVFSKAAISAGMKKVLENYPKYKGCKITDVAQTMDLWDTMPITVGNKLVGTETGCPISFKYDGKQGNVYGTVSYNFDSKTYAYHSF